MKKDNRDELARPLRIHQSVARKLGSDILMGRYAPGESLGGEIEHSEALHVSRTAYREALRILIAKGLVESRPKAGTHVTPRHRWQLLDPDILAWMFSSEPDEAFVRDLFELRGIIEPAAASLAARRRTHAQIDEMHRCLDVMGTLGLACEQGQVADRQFHRVMIEATGNDALISLAGSVGAAVQWTTQFKQRAEANPRDPIREHEALLEAIAAGDSARSLKAMIELIDLALADMKLLPRDPFANNSSGR